MKKIIIRFNAPVILSFALLSLIALLLGNWTNGAATTQYFSVYRSSLADPLTYVRFFGHVLGHSGYDHYMGNMLLLLLVAAGVFLLVKTCTLFGAFQLLLEEGDYRRGRKLEDQRNEAVSTIYWCAVTAVYLAWSFLSGDWHITWVVWPVAGVFWGVIAGILSLVRRSRSKS